MENLITRWPTDSLQIENTVEEPGTRDLAHFIQTDRHAGSTDTFAFSVHGPNISKSALLPQSDRLAGSNHKDATPKGITAQDWTGPNDLDNPLNWPLVRKIYHSCIPALLAFIV